MADVEWVTILEVSEITGLEIGRITDLLKSGELPSCETGRAWQVDRVEAERLAASIAEGVRQDLPVRALGAERSSGSPAARSRDRLAS